MRTRRDFLQWGAVASAAMAGCVDGSNEENQTTNRTEQWSPDTGTDGILNSTYNQTEINGFDTSENRTDSENRTIGNISDLNGDETTDDGNGIDPDEIEFDIECTRVRTTSFDWKSSAFGSEDEFVVELLNRAAVAGVVGIEIRFWESEFKRNKQGTIIESVAIGAQETKEVTITGTAPTSASEYATVVVTDQECR